MSSKEELNNLTKAAETELGKIELSIDEAKERALKLNEVWEKSVELHDEKNKEIINYSEVTKKLLNGVNDETKELLTAERNKHLMPMIIQRYMLLIDAYNNLNALSTFVVNMKDVKLKLYNETMQNIREDVKSCDNCPCKKYFK